MPDSTVLITGAARGLGRALAEEFLTHGWKVIVTDLDLGALEDLKQNSNVQVLRMDVTSDSSVTSAFEEVCKENPVVSLIINNAGIDRYFPFSEAPVERIREVFEVNLFGGYRVNQTFLPILKCPGGRIIHIGSESLHLTVPFMAYPISKNALERYAKVLRQELRFRGIDVVVVRPGAIRTGLLQNVSSIGYPVKDPGLEKAFRKFAESAPKEIKKILDAEEVAGFVFRISQIPHPRNVYRINNSLMLRIVSLLPFSLTEKLIAGRLFGKK
jgi:NAD(P)-dependent dehydrogenase (short-subunit alcohol dehydrogenase family)